MNNNYNNDPIYGIVESTGDTIKIDVLDSEWDIKIKISFGEIECIEMVLDSHLGISIGTDITFGGIGHVISFQ